MAVNEMAFQAALAGLLHDVGKLAQRAGETGSSRVWDAEAQREYQYKHALLSEDFAEKYLPTAWQEEVKSAIGRHHQPRNRLSAAVSLADRLSAGEMEDEAQGEESRDQFPRQLLSIFSDLRLAADGGDVPQAYLPLKPLRMEKENIFPSTDPSGKDVWQEYGGLFTTFTRRLNELKKAFGSATDPDQYLESLLAEMQSVLWCVPSAYYRSRPDINLYDQSRMTAALAAVLYDNPSFTDEKLVGLAQNPEAVQSHLALLVGGDLTGVQSFIYTITSRGAASGLRGRSFYLQLLVLVIARYVLSRLDLPITNLIYAGGGNFYLLARPGDLDRLGEIRAEIGRTLFGEHQGELDLVMEGRLLRGGDFFGGRIRHEWDALIKQINKAKLQRLKDMQHDLAIIFQPQGIGGRHPRQCNVCGREHPGAVEKSVDEGIAERVAKCPVCESYEDLGKDLRKARYLLLKPIPAEIPQRLSAHPGQGWQALMTAFGYEVQVLEDLPTGAEGVVLALNDEAFEQRRVSAKRAYARYFLSNVTPILTEQDHRDLSGKVRQLPVPGSVKPLDVLEAQATGIKRVGVLRMDVDNLGRLFAEGLGDYASLSRIATLSFAVSLFFEGWVGRLADMMKEADRDRLYSIYSGGDDLFFVGSWDALVELAIRIRSDLSAYTCNHPDLHASGGIVLIGGKYPLYQAAEEAGEAESQAKNYVFREDGKLHEKDAISFLGQPLSWAKFGFHTCDAGGENTAHALMHLLERMAKDNENRSLIGKLVRLHELYEDALEKQRTSGRGLNREGQEQVLWGPWNWRAEYVLARLKGVKKEEVEKIRERLKRDQFRSIEWIGMAARWAELITRKS